MCGPTQRLTSPPLKFARTFSSQSPAWFYLAHSADPVRKPPPATTAQQNIESTTAKTGPSPLLPLMAEAISFVASALGLFGFAAGVADVARASKILRKERESGLRICHSPSPEVPEIDIIFIHGLGASGDAAWSDTDLSTGRTLFWPETELPGRIGSRARVAIYNYDAKFRTPEYLTRRTLLHQTNRLVEDLVHLRRGSERTPIVFVCHSLGGLIVKNALVGARKSENPDALDVCSATAGIVFLGTPHNGSPKALADSICGIVGPPNREVFEELHERSKMLAYSLDRFKPLATRLTIYDFFESRRDPNIAQRESPDPRVLGINRSHADLCKYSNPEDKDLYQIINAIDHLCVQAVERSKFGTRKAGTSLYQQREGWGRLMGQVAATLDVVGSVFENVPEEVHSSQINELGEFFGAWFGRAEESFGSSQNAWPVALIRSSEPSGSDKTDLALQYARRHRRRYGSMIWINALTRKSIELSFREVAHRVNSSRDLTSSDFGVNIPADDRDLSDQELGILIQGVTQWMEQLQQQPWLLIIDNLSPHSPFPSQPGWTSRAPRQYTWRELLRLIPSVSGWQGHVIFCTRDPIKPDGLKVISLRTPKTEQDTDGMPSTPQLGGLFTSALPEETPSWSIAAWWSDLGEPNKIRFALALLMSHQECPGIPLSLLRLHSDGDDSEVRRDTDRWQTQISGVIISNDQYREVVILPEYLLKEGPQLLVHRTADLFVNLADEVVSTACWGLHGAIASLRRQLDPVRGWAAEAQLVRNMTAMCRRLDELNNDLVLWGDRRVKVPMGIEWGLLARFCENHGAYGAAAKFYEHGQQQYSHESQKHLELQLLAVHAYHRATPDDASERHLRSAISQESIPIELRISASRSLASWYASQGQLDDAVSLLSDALAHEDPFGANSSERHILQSLSDLATYLAVTGNRSSASSLLQRIVLSLDDTRKKGDPLTLSAMQALSMLKQEEGNLEEAHSLAQAVYECQQRQLGNDHPSTVRSWCRVAAVLDLKGQATLAEDIYRTCLRQAVPRLGPSHPSLFSVRENLARCLLGQGKNKLARNEYNMLRDEIDKYPVLYSEAVVRRVNHFLNGTGSVDDYELDLHLSKRNTIGIADLEDGESTDECEDCGDGFLEYWGDKKDDYGYEDG